MSDNLAEVVIELDKMVYGGDALGRLEDGRAVFVPYCLPGEVVRIKLVEEKEKYARGYPVEIVKPSNERVTPQCMHYGICGGCHYQHTDYKNQLKIKEKVFIEQINRIGGLSTPPVKTITASEKSWNYRNRIEFQVSENGKIGFEADRTALGYINCEQRQSNVVDQVVEIEECFLPQETINSIWPAIVLDPEYKINRLLLRVGEGDNALMILEGEDPIPPEFSVDFPISALYSGCDGLFLMAGDDHTVFEVNGELFRVSTNAFFQVNTYIAGQMVSFILDNLSLTGNEVVVDGYCGCGLFSKFFAQHVKRCIGIEEATTAIDDYSENLGVFDNVDLYIGKMEDVLESIDVKPDIVLVDPPRAGLHKKVIKALIQKSPEKLIYVSCDPATLSRDMKHITKAGYRLDQIQLFDMFPQTYHIECVVLMSRDNS